MPAVRSPSGWFVLSLGWVQESWPRALKQACPDLELPAGLPVNRKQTSALMEEAIAQDPDAAVRGHPDSTGLALAAGAPTVTADELALFLAANDGNVLESPAGTRLVLALGPERDELWRLDAGDDVADTAVLLPTADGAGIAVQWGPSGDPTGRVCAGRECLRGMARRASLARVATLASRREADLHLQPVGGPAGVPERRPRRDRLELCREPDSPGEAHGQECAVRGP